MEIGIAGAHIRSRLSGVATGEAMCRALVNSVPAVGPASSWTAIRGAKS